MKALFAFLLLASALTLRADDALLENGDFSDGLAHWFGNVQSLSTAPDGVPTTEAGALIKLRASEWTNASHDFEIKPGSYKLHVTFTLAPGTQFSPHITDYINIPAKLDFPHEYPSDARPGQWVVAVVDKDAQKSLIWTVNPLKTDPQSYTFTIEGIDFHNRQTLLLAFPPGSGCVTLTNVSLVPAN